MPIMNLRVFPPEFLREAAYRKVDVGEYLLPAPQSDDVGVWQTREQYDNALGLCTQLADEYTGKGGDFGWVDRTRDVLMDEASEIRGRPS